MVFTGSLQEPCKAELCCSSGLQHDVQGCSEIAAPDGDAPMAQGFPHGLPAFLLPWAICRMHGWEHRAGGSCEVRGGCSGHILCCYLNSFLGSIAKGAEIVCVACSSLESGTAEFSRESVVTKLVGQNSTGKLYWVLQREGNPASQKVENPGEIPMIASHPLQDVQGTNTRGTGLWTRACSNRTKGEDF